jgi:tRNA (adenine37-N6)-methyltransferase
MLLSWLFYFYGGLAKELITNSKNRKNPLQTAEVNSVKNREDRIIMSPIGKIKTPFKSLDQCPKQGIQAGAEGEIVLRAEMAPALKDLESCTHLILLSYFHLANRRRLQTKTPFGPEIHGTFATRSPNRPNPIGLHVVELLKIDGLHIRVKGIDCLDGTSLLDIKPYSPEIDAFPHAAIGWYSQKSKSPQKRDRTTQESGKSTKTERGRARFLAVSSRTSSVLGTWLF